MKTIGIVLFDDVELLDFCGPHEVFSSASRVLEDEPYAVITMAASEEIRTNNGLIVKPHHRLADAPSIDYLLVPGGRGTRRAQHDPTLIDWIAERGRHASRVLSVCTGVFLLARARLVDGLALTTHHSAFEALAEIAPDNPLDLEARVLDHGRVVISAGISAGIDMAFSVVAADLGTEVAHAAAHYMEYDWTAPP